MSQPRCLVCGSSQLDPEGYKCGRCGKAMGLREEGCYISEETKKKLLDHATELSKFGVVLEEHEPLQKDIGVALGGISLALQIVDSVRSGSLRDLVLFLREKLAIPEEEILSLRLDEPDHIITYCRGGNMSFRGRYFEALGISLQDKHKLEEARKLAHDIRQFEIELYWKRAAYFWAFQLIAFTALGFLLKDGEIKSLGRLLIPAPLGVITAFAGYLTARGSKFWQQNWEAHVDLLEDATEKRLTQVVLCRKPPEFSVSRINQSLLLLLTLGWTAVLIVGAIPPVANVLRGVSPLWRGIGALIVVGLACGWLRSEKTDFTGRVYRFGETSWTKYSSKREGTVPFIIWRDPPPERREDIPSEVFPK